jgi:hypothetical protein
VQRERCDLDESKIKRLVVIDGLGSAGLIPGHRMPEFMQLKKAQRKVNNLHERIDDLLGDKAAGRGRGMHGFLFHRGES